MLNIYYAVHGPHAFRRGILKYFPIIRLLELYVAMAASQKTLCSISPCALADDALYFGDNCIQNFPLGRYIVVNLVLR